MNEEYQKTDLDLEMAKLTKAWAEVEAAVQRVAARIEVEASNLIWTNRYAGLGKNWRLCAVVDTGNERVNKPVAECHLRARLDAASNVVEFVRRLAAEQQKIASEVAASRELLAEALAEITEGEE